MLVDGVIRDYIMEGDTIDYAGVEYFLWKKLPVGPFRINSHIVPAHDFFGLITYNSGPDDNGITYYSSMTVYGDDIAKVALVKRGNDYDLPAGDI